MRALVVGYGSIGARHAANLSELGHAVGVVEPDAGRRTAAADTGAEVFEDLTGALGTFRAEAAIVCTPSNAHVAPALECAGAGLHLFVEKPLATTLDGVDALVAECEARGLVNMGGCNMRFHPAVARVRELLGSGLGLGRPLWGDFEWGYWLPFARPEDWRESYMANRDLGGDLLLDDIHELDLACWIMGEPVEVLATAARLGEVTADVEDCVDLVVRFGSGARARMHADYLQHGYSRRLKVVAERGTVVWEHSAGRIGVAHGDREHWDWEPAAFDVRYNRMYADEMVHFAACVGSGRPTVNPIADAARVLRTALAARRSFDSVAWEAV